jgi:hypothetical protein
MFRLTFICVLLFVSIACSEPVDYRFGFSAEESSRFLLVTAEFDDYMNVPAGVIGCCLGSGGKSVSTFPEKYPKEGYFVWYDKVSESYYQATLKYPENMKEIADKKLPDFYTIKDYKNIESKRPKRIYLITSITSKNEVITWLANAKMGASHIDRTTIELDRAKGEPFVPEFIKERQRKKAEVVKKNADINEDEN